MKRKLLILASASVRVKIPRIQGNARQELKVYWGKADAASESNGPPCSAPTTATPASFT